MRRYREISAKPGELKAGYGRVDGALDLSYAWGGGGADKSDSRVVMHAFEGCDVHDGRTLRQELEARGYDITTLRFSIQKSAD